MVRVTSKLSDSSRFMSRNPRFYVGKREGILSPLTRDLIAEGRIIVGEDCLYTADNTIRPLRRPRS